MSAFNNIVNAHDEARKQFHGGYRIDLGFDKTQSDQADDKLARAYNTLAGMSFPKMYMSCTKTAAETATTAATSAETTAKPATTAATSAETTAKTATTAATSAETTAKPAKPVEYSSLTIDGLLPLLNGIEQVGLSDKPVDWRKHGHGGNCAKAALVKSLNKEAREQSIRNLIEIEDVDERDRTIIAIRGILLGMQEK